MNTRPTFSLLVQAFFAEHLLTHKRVSTHTICSYRDSLRLLFQYVRDATAKAPADLCVSDLDAPVILAFLSSIETCRGNSVRTRNIRLAAIRSFFRFVALRDPESLPVVTRIMAIPIKRGEKRLVGYLSQDEINALIAAPDRGKWGGRRDHALLLTLYNTGARVSELTRLERNDIALGQSSVILLHGKGRKERQVPLWKSTAGVLRTWLEVPNRGRNDLVFTNARGGRLSRDGVGYILERIAKSAAAACPSLSAKRVTPHTLRHTTAMHLLQSGVEVSVIALWLGHESIETTHMYVVADLETKQRALERIEPIESCRKRFQPCDEVMAFLSTL